MPTTKISKRADELLRASGAGKPWASIGVDSDTNELKYNSDGTVRTVVTVGGSQVLSSLILEGTTDDAYETTIASEPTADRVVTLPDATDTLVGKATTDVFTNKTLTGNINADTKFCTTAFDVDSGTTADTLTNVVGMVQTVVPGTYVFNISVPVTATANSGLKLSWKLTTTVLSSAIYAARAFSASAVLCAAHGTTATDQPDIFSETGAWLYAEVQGRVVVSTGGTIQIQAAQNASHADNTTIPVGAYMTFTRVA